MTRLLQERFKFWEHMLQQDLKQPIAQMGHEGLTLQKIQQVPHPTASTSHIRGGHISSSPSLCNNDKRIVPAVQPSQW